MPAVFSDDEISRLISERKRLPDDWRTRLSMRPKRGHKERQLDLTGEAGNQFRIIMRQSNANPLDFSVILAVKIPNSNRFFRLRRYNGKSHQHTNQIEGNTFYDFHIHKATERYQQIGEREDTYAEVTDHYSDITGALNCLQEDTSFQSNENDQLSLI